MLPFMVLKARSWVVFQVFLALVVTSAAVADQVIVPADGKGWGGGATAESLLNMNRDPEVVRKVDSDKAPIPIRGTCTDDQGRTYTGDDEDYSLCMNRKSSKAKVAPSASVSDKK